MALATTADLEAIGAVKIGLVEADDIYTSATRLLDLASAIVVQYTRSTEAEIGEWPAAAQTAVAAVVAEVAGRRLTSPAAPTADQLGTAPFMAVKLFPSDRESLSEIPEVAAARRSATPTSIGVSRANSWFITTGQVTES
jgi:hypothetical protein